ncbi:MAG: hypothetical protein COT14_04070 [Candidatus Diapherotrites archaeon CG08_land_8_20_14_0_20_30_16]|nr:MAG: hypothetical protein COT14_04070 [Candidatus Diapherotrites archaeon CG08_land_8_20_14_0_20_30_16]
MERTNSFKVKIFIKTQAKRNEFLGYDNEKGAYIFKINCPAFEGKANKELLKFLKELKINAKILQGETSHFKVLLVENSEKAASLFVPTH